MNVNKTLTQFLVKNNGFRPSEAGNTAQLNLTEESKKELLKTFLRDKKVNNYILLVIVLMFIIVFFVGCYFIFYYRTNPEILKIIFGGTFFSITTIIYGLQRLWRQKNYMDYLILLIQNLPADRVGEIIQTIIFQSKLIKVN